MTQNLNIFTPNTLKNVPETPGVYILKDKKETVLYIGKAKNLKKRLISHFKDSTSSGRRDSFKKHIQKIEIIKFSSEFESLIYEAELIRKYKPKYNVIWKDDKHYIYIHITKEEFPKIRYARRQKEKKGYFYGPYPGTSTVRDLVSLSRRIIPFCTQRSIGKRSCFYTHIGLCNPCPADIIKLPEDKRSQEKKKYRKNIKLLRLIFEGKIKKLERHLRQKMTEYKEAKEYEKAALQRDKLIRLNEMTKYSKSNIREENLDTQNLNIFEKEEENVIEVLKPVYKDIKSLNWIECYDISNISGRLTTASMVTFRDGAPYKDRYRRFRIRRNQEAGKPDDYSAMREVLLRRLNHKDWPFPDLIVVDGGKGQVRAAWQILSLQNIAVPVIGLAKRLEEIVIPQNGSFKTQILDRQNRGLHLLQRIRDEAHRFAHKYHQLLRLKQILKN